MSRIDTTITIDAPVHVVYDQWTQLEAFPEIMESVDGVRQLDDRTVEWTARIAGRTKRWTARIVDQTPDTRIAWKSVDGADVDGAVLFRDLGAGRTELRLVVDVEPQGPVEAVGDAIGLVDRRIEADLDRFRSFVESRGSATGAWAGTIHGDRMTPDR
jgi:uncharacterized membrane protein